MSETVQIALIAAGVTIVGGFVVQIPAIIIALATRREMVALKTHVNSNTEQLVRATKELAHAVGKAEGIAEGAMTATAVASEVAKAVEVAKTPHR